MKVIVGNRAENISPQMLDLLESAFEAIDDSTTVDARIYADAIVDCLKLGLLKLGGTLADGRLELTDLGYIVLRDVKEAK